MKIHIVKQGDTLYALSQKYGVPLKTIIETNPQISNPDVLVIGDKVKIPAVPVSALDNNSDVYHKHTVKQGDTLWKLSKAWGIPLQEMIKANPQLKNPDVLKVGEVVIIPKKGTMPSIQPMQMPNIAGGKTQPGGKAYTGPIEQPGGKTYTGPIEQPVGKTYTAPIEQPPKVVPPPVVAEPVKPVEIAPVQEMVHQEKQSLYVQISVPVQEAVSFYENVPVPEVKPVHMVQPDPCNCDKLAGYPGLTENPNFYDCPPSYPLYEPMPDMTMNAQMQPAMYEPDCMPPYFYPGNMYNAAEFPAPWYPNAAPQYNEHFQNMPWPTSCGCGMGGQVLPNQNYPHEVPMYNSLPVYANQALFNPYCAGMPQMSPHYAAPAYPQNLYSSPMVSNIPSIPEYPGMGNENYGYHNRVAEFQQTNIIQENLQSTDADSLVSNTDEATVRKGVTKEASLPKVKTSSRDTNQTKTEASKAQRAKKSKTSSTSKKRRNPWISN
ncbi:LysM domain-containing protein [Paenibacillus sp. BR2-3]|uniref:LysM peptidoglycan-binding domain-containing protein n=1 Tax=Paenibacillus sp. BR2-3 TaxID=3048494 RepID=UPI0039777FC6